MQLPASLDPNGVRRRDGPPARGLDDVLKLVADSGELLGCSEHPGKLCCYLCLREGGCEASDVSCGWLHSQASRLWLLGNSYWLLIDVGCAQASRLWLLGNSFWLLRDDSRR